MKRNLRDTLFGFRARQDADGAAIRKQQTLAAINETETVSVQAPRMYPTIGSTEQRLRARNKQSWKTSTPGWSNFLGRFVR